MKRSMKVLIPLVIIVSGAGLTLLVGQVDSAPAPTTERPPGLPVRVVSVTAPPAGESSLVTATGLVQPAKQVALAAQVGGRIRFRSPSLVPGGRVRRGEPLVRLDRREYELRLQQEQARVEAAALELRTEQSRQAVAAREWQLLGQDRPAEEAEFALRRPHVAAAQAALASAESGEERARLDVARTVVRAPFNAVVQRASAEVGQLVSPGATMATLVGTDQLWVRVSVPVDRLPDLALPGVNSSQGARAMVIHQVGADRRVERQGHVLRLEGQLAEATRTATLLVAVDQPLDLPAGAVPLLPGTLVTVELEGRPLEGVYEIPQAALREGATLWLVDEEQRLVRRQVQLRWARGDRVYVTSSELRLGDRVVTSPLARPLAGQEVQVTGGPGLGRGQGGGQHGDQS